MSKEAVSGIVGSMFIWVFLLVNFAMVFSGAPMGRDASASPEAAFVNSSTKQELAEFDAVKAEVEAYSAEQRAIIDRIEKIATKVE